MTTKTDRTIRLAFFLAGLPFLYFIFSSAERNWLYYFSFFAIIGGIFYSLISDWNQGKRREVKRRLMFYGVILLIMIVIGLFRN